MSLPLDEIEEKTREASPGPWRFRSDGPNIHDTWQFSTPSAGRPVMSNLTTAKGLRPTDADAEFIANARQWVPDLVAALRVVEAENEKLRVLLRQTLPFVRCVNEPCECGRDLLHASCVAALAGGLTQ